AGLVGGASPAALSGMVSSRPRSVIGSRSLDTVYKRTYRPRGYRIGAFIEDLIFLSFFVAPAKAGVQGDSEKRLKSLDSGLRRNDGEWLKIKSKRVMRTLGGP
ncbi:MAG TPA: hypothetical protein PKZ97_13790, partial [Azospirillaceae bacterium]|nr:hypothetical protein [Azospirillaceae bacterium]